MTLLVHALRQYPAHMAWVSLDPDDSDPDSFVRYILVALQKYAPSLGETGGVMFKASPAPTLTAIMSQVINAMADLPYNLLLMLEDYHVIGTEAIIQAISFFLDHLPPDCTWLSLLAKAHLSHLSACAPGVN